jgi:murein DD-endopeptidase MepM/ murein hydrolase activator NlpD
MDVEIFNGNPVNISWYEYGQEYEYMLKLFQIKGDEETLIFTSDWFEENELEIEIDQEGSYLWQTYIKEIDKTCEQKHQCWDIESGYFDLYLPQKEDDEEEIVDEEDNGLGEDKEVENVKEEEKINKEIKNVDENIEEIPKVEVKVKPKREILGTSTTKQPRREEEETEKETEEKVVKGITEKSTAKKETNYCNFQYNVEKKKFTLLDCKIDEPKITSSTYYRYKNQYVVSSKGEYIDRVKIYIDNTVCKDFDLLNTKTWFRCQEVVISSNEYSVDFNHGVYFYKDKLVSPTNFIYKDSSFEISRIYGSIPSHLVFKGYFSVDHRGSWLDKELGFKKGVEFKESKDGSNSSGSGIYSFPFSKIVHVNQWHGCTAYQCPHKGIDFAAVKDNIYASDNGTVVSKGYDTYYGECNSGGKYLVVKYDGGHHMAYLHLQKSYVNVNQRVSKGNLIALSGNSGAKNCQPLGYHLHFELRKERSQSTHTNPVPYINVDWNLVKTNRSDIYPKRLSGDNPHPNF